MISPSRDEGKAKGASKQGSRQKKAEKKRKGGLQYQTKEEREARSQ